MERKNRGQLFGRNRKDNEQCERCEEYPEGPEEDGTAGIVHLWKG